MAMDVKLDTEIFFLIHLILIISFTTLPQTQSHSMEDGSCSLCNLTYNCGTIRNISYPFWGQGRPRYCGSDNLFKLECHGNQTTSIQIGQQNFNVVSIEPIFYAMKMVRSDLSAACPWNFTNTSLDRTLFRHDNYTFHNLTIFSDCPTQVSSTNNITCKADQRNKVAFHANEAELQKWPHLLKCGVHIQMRVQRGITEDEMKQLNRVLSNGFVVHYIADWPQRSTCNFSGGICGTGLDDGIHDSQRPKKSPWNWKRKLIVGGVASSFSVIVMSIAFYLYLRRYKNRYAKSTIQSQLQTMSSDSSLKDLEGGSKYFGVHLFTYSELEEATNYFDSTRELGDGGFGTVYCGKLGDGRTVAVKRLYENNCRRMEQFMNEVEILTRLHHQNLVSLYGCTSRHSRELLLVYEYIPNGTVADHLHGERAKPGSLPWHVRINIAIETASALAYLHASDIIHRDVKTTNILLDNHFCVKVADFGLSRLFPNDVTHISTAPQGTPGYVDPEYHQCYQLTDKSDVYSFGVVLIELISSIPAVDITRHRHEINLSNMAINKIQNGALPELVDPILGFEADYKVRKMINAVAELAFQCLQSVKDMRPSMEHVLQRLMDIENDGKDKTKAEEMDISADDVVVLKNEPPPPSPDSNLRSTCTTPNASG